MSSGWDYVEKLEIKVERYEAALRDIAIGLRSEDSAADHHNRYELCAGRLCAVARNAISGDGSPASGGAEHE